MTIYGYYLHKFKVIQASVLPVREEVLLIARRRETLQELYSIYMLNIIGPGSRLQVADTMGV